MPGSVKTHFNDHVPSDDDAWKLRADDVADTVAYVVSTPPNVLVHRAEVDVLVNNAGIGMLKPFMETTAAEWQRTIDVNVNALYHVTRAVLPAMIAKKSGHVCTIGSIAGRGAFVGGSCYAATKAFVTSWSESLMLEVREHGVKVSVVMPGSVTTHFNDHVPSDDDSWKLSAADVADTVAYVIATPPNMLVHRAEVRTLTVPHGRARR